MDLDLPRVTVTQILEKRGVCRDSTSLTPVCRGFVEAAPDQGQCAGGRTTFQPFCESDFSASLNDRGLQLPGSGRRLRGVVRVLRVVVGIAVECRQLADGLLSETLH